MNRLSGERQPAFQRQLQVFPDDRFITSRLDSSPPPGFAICAGLIPFPDPATSHRLPAVAAYTRIIKGGETR